MHRLEAGTGARATTETSKEFVEDFTIDCAVMGMKQNPRVFDSKISDIPGNWRDGKADGRTY